MGRLTLVGTPLGNREDLSPRARRAIEQADLLLCEDTRSVTRLLGEGASTPPKLSCFAANEPARVPVLLERLEQGQTVAFISEAGMPVWSDPGRLLVAAAVDGGHEIDVIPGPTAAATALCHAGFSARRACFFGFPPRDGGSRRQFFAEVAKHPGAAIVYEAGNRMVAFLRDLAGHVEPTRRLVVTRELTKAHQEVLRGPIEELVERVIEPLRGEVTIVVDQAPEAPDDPGQQVAIATMQALLDPSLKPRQKAKKLAELTGLDANSIYRLLGSGRG